MKSEALIMVAAVGWTSASAVHRIPLRRWWTALRLSTLRRPAAGSGSQATLPPPSPLRTVLATFTAHGSSLDKPL